MVVSEPFHQRLMRVAAVNKNKTSRTVLGLLVALIVTAHAATVTACAGSCACVSVNGRSDAVGRAVSEPGPAGTARQHGDMTCHRHGDRDKDSACFLAAWNTGQCDCSGLTERSWARPTKTEGPLTHASYQPSIPPGFIDAWTNHTGVFKEDSDPPDLGFNLIYHYHQLRR